MERPLRRDRRSRPGTASGAGYGPAGGRPMTRRRRSLHGVRTDPRSGAPPMETRTDEVVDGIYRFSTFIPEVGIPFNQYLVVADEPLLFHTGMHGLFPLVSEAVARVMPLERLRWISFGHYEADECGAMNDWLAVAPDAQVTGSAIAVMVSVDDQAA